MKERKPSDCSEHDQEHRPNSVIFVYDGFVRLSAIIVENDRIVTRRKRCNLPEVARIIHVAEAHFIEEHGTAGADVFVSLV